MKFNAVAVLGFAVLFLWVGLPVSGYGAEFHLVPTLAVSEIYTDNLYNDNEGEVTEFITRFLPTVALEYEAPRIVADLAYSFDYRLYARGERDNESTHIIAASALATLVKNLAFLEVKDSYEQVSLDSTRDFAEESLFDRQSDRNVFSASPYLKFGPYRRFSLETGYRFTDVRYERDTGTDKQSHAFFADSDYELTERTRFTSGYSYTIENTEEDDYTSNKAWGGLRHQYMENSFIYGNLGYVWIDFDRADGEDNFYWDLGITHDFGTLTGSARVAVDYQEDPEGTILRREYYDLTLIWYFQRGSALLSLDYSDYLDAATDEVDTRRYGGDFSVQYELAPRLSGSAGFSWKEFEERDKVEAGPGVFIDNDTDTRRLITSVSLAYLLGRDFTATLGYYFIDSHSPQEEDDRYESNRIILEVRKTF